MLKLLSSIFFVFLIITCNAQGSWDIGYIHVDSINQKHIDQVFRIDFKSSYPWTSSVEQRGIRSYVSIKDTAVVTIGSTEYILAERRKIYVDHGSYQDQYLECINCNQKSFIIYDAKILEVHDTYIQFQVEIELKENEEKRQEFKVVRIDKSKLDGLMIKR